MSTYGRWTEENGLPAFAYEADHHAIAAAEWDTQISGKTRRHWLGIGNRRIQAFVDNEGTVALFDEHEGLRWLLAPEPFGSGISWIEEAGSESRWGSRFEARPKGTVPVRTFGPTWFRVEAESDALKLERTVLCPLGEVPWVLVRVRLSANQHVKLRHTEEWAARPRFVNLAVAPALTREDQLRLKEAAERIVQYRIELDPGEARARERYLGDPNVPIPGAPAERAPVVFGTPVTLHLEALGGTGGLASHDGAAHPTLRLATDLEIGPGETRELWFRFGVDDGSRCDAPRAMFEASLRNLRERLPRARSAAAPMAEREIPWHAAILTGQACRDALLGGHTLDQGSAYSFHRGFNGAARDPLQHALPLVYFEPDLALSVLRNTAAWGAPTGRLPWAIDGSKAVRVKAITPGKSFDRPSDLSLWSLWLASEYAAVTNDLAAFRELASFHPMHRAAPVPLCEHLRRHFRYLIDEVGFGAHGHLRVLDCDWADGHLGEVRRLGLDRSTIVAEGESILNSAMAAWVLPVFAGLCERLEDKVTATEARKVGHALRERVAQEWNGRWYRRARCRNVVLGEDTLFLEVQPWAILCGAADEERGRALLKTVDEHLRKGSPLGARQRWPLPSSEEASGKPGEALAGGIWPSLQMTLIWAAARLDPELGWDEWRRFTLASHTARYPQIWEGTLSGPDAYNAPESNRPGSSYAFAHFSMQGFPVNNLHIHAQPIISYLRLLGVEPLPDGKLSTASGSGQFSSSTFHI